MSSLYSSCYHIYYLLCLSFLYNTSDSACDDTSDDLTHIVCYASGEMDSTTLGSYYNRTITTFKQLPSHGYTLSSIECESETDANEIPNSIDLEVIDCFTCCITTVSSNVDSDEYTKWRLLYIINDDITEFATHLTTQSHSQSLTHIFYASSSNIESSSCTSSPRICNYPLSSAVDFFLTLTLNTAQDQVTFEFSYESSEWFGIGVGAMSSTGYAIMFSADNVTDNTNNVAEWILMNHTNPSPAPTSVYGDPTQNLLTATFTNDGTTTIECTRSYTLNQNGITSEQFTDTTSSIIIYAAWGTASSSIVNDHTSTNRVSPVNILITPVSPDNYWCTNKNDCGIYLGETSSPTYVPTSDPTMEPTIPTTNPSPSPTIPTYIPTFIPTFQPTTNPTYIPTTNPTVYPTFHPTNDPTSDPTYEPTYIPTHDPTNDPTFKPTFHPSNDPTFEPTFHPTNDPTSDPTYEPTYIPTYIPTTNPTVYPTFHPTNDPTSDPTYEPTYIPTHDPTNDPTFEPTFHPTNDPTSDPTFEPTLEPTTDPTNKPTVDPTIDPTKDPTLEPTSDPSSDPTIDPTNDPSVDPTTDPTSDPTIDPTYQPTLEPTADPTNDPTTDPTIDPTNDPTTDPSYAPTNDPTTDPTKNPTFSPTPKPTLKPTAKPVGELAPTASPNTPRPTHNPTASPTDIQSFDWQNILLVLVIVGGLGVVMIIFGCLQFIVERRETTTAIRGVDFDDDLRADDDQNLDGFMLVPLEDESEDDENNFAMDEFMMEAEAEMIPLTEAEM